MIKLRGGVWWMDARVNGRRIRQSLGTADKLKAMLQAGLIASQAGRAPAAAGPTLDDAYKAALRSRAKWRDAKDQRGIEGTHGEVTGHFGKDRALASITDEDVLTWIEAMQKDKQAPSTINRKLSHLSVLCKESRLPVPRMPRFTIPQGRIRVITEAELTAMKGHLSLDMRDLVDVLVGTAARLSEVLRIGLRDVDLAAGTVSVWENKASQPRTVPLSDAALAVLTRRCRVPLPGAFSAPFAGLTVDHADKEWAKARKAIGLGDDPQFVIHALRHTSLSRMAQAGHDAFSIQAFAGHKRIATTQKYVHLDVSRLRALACVHDQHANRSPAGEDDRSAGTGGTVNPQVPGSSPGRGAK